LGMDGWGQHFQLSGDRVAFGLELSRGTWSGLRCVRLGMV